MIPRRQFMKINYRTVRVARWLHSMAVCLPALTTLRQEVSCQKK